ncbi:MAG: UDP-glucose 4-epimerase GalE [Verrucomicrobia bacterium]|nr:UDP-glucose 4-epimerase GalE [Verrucomicrobiota bacterium]
MKVFVTGGAGYIGSVVSELLLDEGHEVVVFDNLELGHRAAVDARAQFICGDLRDPDTIESAVQDTRPDAIMHFAAYALVGESMRTPESYYRNNLVGALYLADAALRADVPRFIFSSTCATYGQPDQLPITEDTPQRPTNPYGESKLAFEKALNWYSQCHGLTTTFFRYFNACGATARLGEDHDPEAHLIPIVLQVALGQRDHVNIYGGDYDTPDGTCIRDYIHIVDLARAHALALTQESSDVFNLGTGTGFSVKEVVDVVKRVTARNIPVKMAPRRPGDPARLVAAADKAREVLGWTPKYDSLESIVESAWTWHQAHPHGYDD